MTFGKSKVQVQVYRIQHLIKIKVCAESCLYYVNESLKCQKMCTRLQEQRNLFQMIN